MVNPSVRLLRATPVVQLTGNHSCYPIKIISITNTHGGHRIRTMVCEGVRSVDPNGPELHNHALYLFEVNGTLNTQAGRRQAFEIVKLNFPNLVPQ